MNSKAQQKTCSNNKLTNNIKLSTNNYSSSILALSYDQATWNCPLYIKNSHIIPLQLSSTNWHLLKSWTHVLEEDTFCKLLDSFLQACCQVEDSIFATWKLFWPSTLRPLFAWATSLIHSNVWQLGFRDSHQLSLLNFPTASKLMDLDLTDQIWLSLLA